MSKRFSIQNTFGKISDGLLEGMGCVLISTIQGAKHLVVAIKGKPSPRQEFLPEWELVHRMERGELFDGKDSHTVWIMD